MFFGDPYVIDVESATGTVTLYQPCIGDLIKIGQEKFFSSLSILITNTTSYRLPLWEMGIDWNEFSDFSLFLLLYKRLDPDVVKMLFGDLDVLTFEVFSKQIEDKEILVLYNEELEIEINEEVYFHISQYFRKAFNMNPEEKITKDPIMKQWFINKDKRQLEIDKKKEEKGQLKSSTLLPLISACLNHPGFKYDLDGIRKLTVGQFYDSVHRLQIYENSTAIMKGMYSGFVDGKKIKPEDYNFMKEIK